MAQITSRPRFPFTRLPPDVQYNVCQSLCAHCGNGDPMALLYHSPAEQTETLRNLALTSRCMQSLTQGILYHFPRVHSYTDFFRTLRARPDLADSVKVLTWIYDDERKYHRHWPPSERPERSPREDIIYLRSLAMELKLQDTGLVEFEDMFEYYPAGAEGDDHGSAALAMDVAFDNLATSITMALCARLEFLSINLEDGWHEDRDRPDHQDPAKFPFLPGLIKQRPEGFRFLQTLVLQNTLHHDPNTLGIDRASFLWNLFPNTKCLIFFKCRSEEHNFTDILVPEDELRPEDSWEALPHLKDLRFLRYSRNKRELPLPAIARLISKCKELEKFSFSPGPFLDKPFSPSRLMQIISSTAPTLRQLTVNCPIPNGSAIPPEELVGPELMKFTQLESLILDQAVFCHHHHLPDITKGAGCLTDILPHSLRRLTVNMCATFAPIVDLVALGEAVSRGSFPNLTHLRAQMTFEDVHWPEVDNPTTKAQHQFRVAPNIDRPPEVNKPLLEPRRSRRRLISSAFEKTRVVLDIECFRRRDYYACCERLMQLPQPPIWSDAKLIDDEEFMDVLAEK